MIGAVATAFPVKNMARISKVATATAALVVGACASAPSVFDPAALRTSALDACTSELEIQPGVPGISVEAAPSATGDLARLRIQSVATGSHMYAYYDAPSRGAALSHAACLGAQLALLDIELKTEDRNVAWMDVVFTSDRAYLPPRGEGANIRWIISTDPSGRLNQEARHNITATVPHEQVHQYQARMGATTPRWFAEGHATWVGLKVASTVSPDNGAADAELFLGAARHATLPLELSEWGSVSVKPEAIARQISDEDKARMLTDPSFRPKGPFSFGPDDLISDESNATARYGASSIIFSDLAARHGEAAVAAWVAATTAVAGRVSADQVLSSAKTAFGEDLEPLLR